MSIRSVQLTTLAAAALLFGGHAHAQRSAGPTASVTPDAARADGVRRSRSLKTEAQRKVLAALNADPRYAGLQKELAEAAKITDQTMQSQKLRSIATRGQTLRTDAIHRAGADVRAIESELLTARKLPPPAPPIVFRPPRSRHAAAAAPGRAAHRHRVHRDRYAQARMPGRGRHLELQR